MTEVSRGALVRTVADEAGVDETEAHAVVRQVLAVTAPTGPLEMQAAEHVVETALVFLAHSRRPVRPGARAEEGAAGYLTGVAPD